MHYLGFVCAKGMIIAEGSLGITYYRVKLLQNYNTPNNFSVYSTVFKAISLFEFLPVRLNSSLNQICIFRHILDLCVRKESNGFVNQETLSSQCSIFWRNFPFIIMLV